MTDLSPERLEEAFQAIALALREAPSAPTIEPCSARRIEAAFEVLGHSLSDPCRGGGLLNPWSLAGLKRDEVRNVRVLAGLWTREFGGAASTLFLRTFLDEAVPAVDWGRELADGYRISTEISPLGDRSDRVDLLVETRAHVVGIEVKIDAGLGFRQIERYRDAIDDRARRTHRSAHVVLLSRMPWTTHQRIGWGSVRRAARRAAGPSFSSMSAIEGMISAFGDHVAAFEKG